MDGHPSSLRSARPALHQLPPCTPVRDQDERHMRLENFRASMEACPSSWRSYFEALASEMEREMG
jgi:hypothetical protein